MPAFVDSAIDHANGAGPFAPDLTGLTSAGHFLLAKCFTAQDDADFTAPSTDWWLFGYKTGNGNTVKVFYKFSTGSDGTYSFTLTGSSAPTSVVISIYSGVSPTNPFDGFSHLESFLNDATPTPPPFTSVTDDPLAVLWMGSQLGSTMSGGAPSGYTLDVDYSGATYDDRQQFIATKDLTTPATETPGDWTHSASPGNTEDGYQAGFALQEPQTTPDPFPEISQAVLGNSTIATTNHVVGVPLVLGGSIGNLEIIIFVFRGAGSFSISALPPGFDRIDGAITSITDKRIYVGWRQVMGDETASSFTTSADTYSAFHHLYLVNWDPDFPPVMVEAAGLNAGELETEMGSNLFIAALGAESDIDLLPVGLNGAPSGYNFIRQRVSPSVDGPPSSLHTATKQAIVDAEDPGAWDEPTGSNWAGLIGILSGPAGIGIPSTVDGWGIPI